MLHKLRIALTATLVALAAVSAVDSASAGWVPLAHPDGGPSFSKWDHEARYP
jgi:hypothetical protein